MPMNIYETFKCPICKTEFITPEELRVHRINTHKGQIHEIGLGSFP